MSILPMSFMQLMKLYNMEMQTPKGAQTLLMLMRSCASYKHAMTRMGPGVTAAVQALDAFVEKVILLPDGTDIPTMAQFAVALESAVKAADEHLTSM